MTNDPTIRASRGRPLLRFVLLACAVASGCGQSEEDRLRKQVRHLNAELEDSSQRHEDLKARMQAIRARNKVLIGLVEGLTSEPDKAGTDEQDTRAPLGSASRALAELDKDIDFLAKTLRASRKDFEEMRSERQTLRANLAEAMRTIEAAKRKEQQAKLRADTARQMILKLKSLIEAEELELQIVRNQMVIELPEATLFEADNSQLKYKGRQLLTKLSKLMKAIKSRNFQVAGHMDSVPNWNRRFLANWDLSARRAVTVTRFLVRSGVDHRRLSAAGYADTKPIVPVREGMQNRKQAQEQNRRIEIILLPNLEELPDLRPLMDVFDEAKSRPAGAEESATPGEGRIEPAQQGSAEENAKTPTAQTKPGEQNAQPAAPPPSPHEVQPSPTQTPTGERSTPPQPAPNDESGPSEPATVETPAQ